MLSLGSGGRRLARDELCWWLEKGLFLLFNVYDTGVFGMDGLILGPLILLPTNTELNSLFPFISYFLSFAKRQFG